jgi:sugar phosphate isomerase/epimerase
LKSLLDYAGGRIKFCLENTHSIPPQFRDVIVSLINEKGLRLVWDIGHAELLNGRNKSMLFNFFQENIKAVDLFHLHDITENGDHKELGTGRVNIPAYVEIINMIGADVILEIFPRQAVMNSIKYLFNIEKTQKTS